jgi:hypothetical protein
MIKAVYDPDTSWLTRDVEKEKMELLCHHSENVTMA